MLEISIEICLKNPLESYFDFTSGIPSATLIGISSAIFVNISSLTSMEISSLIPLGVFQAVFRTVSKTILLEIDTAILFLDSFGYSVGNKNSF